MSVINGHDRSLEPIFPPNTASIDALSDVTIRTVVMIDPRALSRECFVRSITARDAALEVQAFGSMQDWKSKRGPNPSTSAILFNIGGGKLADSAVAQELRSITAEFQGTPVIVLADSDELPQILTALECGARGYIPSSVNVGVCVEAIGLALAGGVFVPASSVLAMRKFLESGGEASQPMAGMFTLRQAEVVQALRRGKANKIIAYELHLRESTVKVHIRNIMKKLKATNRTEVAFKINDMFPESFDGKGRFGAPLNG